MSENAIREGSGEVWKVGALAQRTGLSVRALHHYDQIGLLTPSQRSTSGHRLYSAADAERLYRIRVLRRLGFPLDHIADLLSQSQWQLEEAVANHLVDARRTASVATDWSHGSATSPRPSRKWRVFPPNNCSPRSRR